ncbi:MAG TPA: type II toxin-antitoxin system prevent-host-death family antitoxin [Verrucomicrobiae bacterium]|jgi:prevent-host-death family protein|nr:type II toxin-antitoxin system prevent-host-death family antitoxin [Verrucomicrobiae bacterium]
MASVTASEAKTRFGQLLGKVVQGEEVVITKYDKPVARLIPEDGRSLQAVREAVANLRDLRQRIAARPAGKAQSFI